MPGCFIVIIIFSCRADEGRWYASALLFCALCAGAQRTGRGLGRSPLVYESAMQNCRRWGRGREEARGCVSLHPSPLNVLLCLGNEQQNAALRGGGAGARLWQPRKAGMCWADAACSSPLLLQLGLKQNATFGCSGGEAVSQPGAAPAALSPSGGCFVTQEEQGRDFWGTQSPRGSRWKQDWIPMAPVCALSTEMRQYLATHQKQPGHSHWCQRRKGRHKSIHKEKALGIEATDGEVPSSDQEMPPMLCHMLGADLPPPTNSLPWHRDGGLISRVSPGSIACWGQGCPFLGAYTPAKGFLSVGLGSETWQGFGRAWNWHAAWSQHDGAF